MRHGFTLIELIIVVLILGILVVAAFPQLTASITDARLHAITSEIVTAVEFAQLSAMSAGRACRVQCNAGNETVWVEQVANSNMADLLNPAVTELAEADLEGTFAYVPMAHPLKGGAHYLVDFDDGSWFGGINIVAVVFSSGSALVFDATGAPSCETTITVAYGGRQAVLGVDPLTGKITEQ